MENKFPQSSPDSRVEFTSPTPPFPPPATTSEPNDAFSEHILNSSLQEVKPNKNNIHTCPSSGRCAFHHLVICIDTSYLAMSGRDLANALVEIISPYSKRGVGVRVEVEWNVLGICGNVREVW
jgi:hypothetical protein